MEVMAQYDIFISYKRKSIYMANNLYYRLTMKGYRVFFDLDEMRNDRFDKQIYTHIKNAKDVIVLLEEGSLNAIYNNTTDKDWFCKEICFALKEEKNIIPLLLDGYQMPSEEKFPEDMKGFSYRNALPFGGLNYFDNYIQQLEERGYLISHPVNQDKGKSLFKFFSNEDCEVFENGKQIGEIKGRSDEPFYYFVSRKGKYRFKSVNKYSGAEKTETVYIDNDAEEIIDLTWPEREMLFPEEMTKLSLDDIVPISLGQFTFNMLRVDGGDMTIGATESQSDYAYSNENPLHSISVKTFYISEFPVTQNLYQLVMGYNNSHFEDDYNNLSELSDAFRGGILGFPFGPLGSALGAWVFGGQTHQQRVEGQYSCKNHNPVEMVSLTDAQKFCQRLSKMTSFNFDLPTEEEWEYAAMGGKKSRGYIYAGSNDIEEVAWYRDNGDAQTHPVGQKKPNELGIYDMSGNVWEWTNSHVGSCTDGQSRISEILYVRKGGSWWHEASNCKVSNRLISNKDKKTTGLGFRIVLRVS